MLVFWFEFNFNQPRRSSYVWKRIQWSNWCWKRCFLTITNVDPNWKLNDSYLNWFKQSHPGTFSHQEFWWFFIYWSFSFSISYLRANLMTTHLLICLVRRQIINIVWHILHWQIWILFSLTSWRIWMNKLETFCWSKRLFWLILDLNYSYK